MPANFAKLGTDFKSTVVRTVESMSDQDELSSLREKINDLESDLGYLQRDYETQNQMIVVDEGRIQKLEHSVLRINLKLDALIAASQSPRTVEDDIPPHY